ncbi:MAG: DUF2085 domain-containing protein [Candidatus Polarisedimenticolia bacterium]
MKRGAGAMKARASAWLVVAAAAAALCLSMAPPLLVHGGHARAGTAIRIALAPICHQDPARSFHLAARPMGVCARCAGVQAGFLAASLALAGAVRARRKAPLRPPRPVVLTLAAAPMAAQWLLARLPLGYPALDGNPVRALTGALFGVALSTYVLPAVVEMVEEITHARRLPRSEERTDVATA